MTGQREAWVEALASALEAHAVAVVQMAPGRWSFVPGSAPALSASAWVRDRWLLVDAALPEPRPALSAAPVLSTNARLPGTVKVCIAGSRPALRLRADVALHDVPAVPRAVRDFCTGLPAAVGHLCADRACRPSHATASSAGTSAAGVDVSRLCAETDWAWTMRGTDTVMVELDVPGTFQQAAVRVHPERGVTVSVPIVTEVPRTPVCEAAVCAFLLRVTGAVRLVRAATGGSEVPAVLEVVHAAVPTSEALADSFAALSLAWRHAGREAAVLATDEPIAGAYLRATSARAP